MTDNHKAHRPATTLSARQIGRLLKKLCIHDGDIVLIKPDRFNEDEIFELLRKGVEHLKLKAVYLVIVKEFDDIRVMNKQEMNSNGWWHISQISKVVRR